MKRSGHPVAVGEQLPSIPLGIGEKSVLGTAFGGLVKGQDSHKRSLPSAPDKPQGENTDEAGTESDGPSGAPDSLRGCL